MRVRVSSLGDRNHVASNGDLSQIVCFGANAKIANSGDNVHIICNGDNAIVASSGWWIPSCWDRAAARRWRIMTANACVSPSRLKVKPGSAPV